MHFKYMASVYLKGAAYFANGDNWTKCDKPALCDSAECRLLQPYFSFAMQHHIEFIVIESMNLGISEKLNLNFK